MVASREVAREQDQVDQVGDNVGDVAGMGSDLFGSFAEATCAASVGCSAACIAWLFILTNVEIFPGS